MGFVYCFCISSRITKRDINVTDVLFKDYFFECVVLPFIFGIFRGKRVYFSLLCGFPVIVYSSASCDEASPPLYKPLWANSNLVAVSLYKGLLRKLR